MGRGSRTGRRALRVIAAALIVAGALLIVDVVLTLTWQEPISSLIAKRSQARLGHELTTLGRRTAPDRARAARVRDLRRRLAWLAAREARRLTPGAALGRIELPALHRSYVVVQGTDGSDLRKGPGHYSDTPLPGQRGTVALAGHRTTYLAPFRTIDRL